MKGGKEKRKHEQFKSIILFHKYQSFIFPISQKNIPTLLPPVTKDSDLWSYHSIQLERGKKKKISIFRASLFRLKYFYFFYFFLFILFFLTLSIFLFLCDKHLCTAVTQIHKIVEVNYLSKPALVRRLKIEIWFLYGSKPSRHGKTKTI